MPTQILLVDDEPHIIELNQLYLEAEGFGIITAANGRDALEVARTEKPDLVVLDLMMPEMDGWETCRRLRQFSQVPIIMLTARSEDVDRIVGLELGADDYVTKPFNPRELSARVRAVLRRASGAQAPAETMELQVGALRLIPERREAWLGGELLTLRSKEFSLLAYLMDNAGIALSREQILTNVWGYEDGGESRTVDVHVAAVRRALRGGDVEIETVWGIGYRLRAA